MAQPNVVPAENEVETLGKTAKRWLTTFTKNVSDGTVSHLVSDLRDALKLRGKSVDVPSVNDTFAYYDLGNDKIAFKVPEPEVDAQIVSATDTIAITSLAFIDVPGMTLTTSGSKTKKYLINFSCDSAQSNNDKIVSVIINIDGTDVVNSKDDFSHTNASSVRPRTQATHWVAEIAPGKIVKVRWKVDANTGYMTFRRLSIYGVK